MPDPSTNRPNVLLIVADQWRYDAAGFAGNAQVKTPHCDALASGGGVFTRAFCPFPVCTPCRYSMMTGLYARQHLGLGNQSTPRPDVATWPALLRDAGYRTAAVGKMHFTPTRLDVGFDGLQLVEQHGEGRFEDDYHRDLLAAGLIDREDLTDQREEYRGRASAAYWQTFGAQATSLPDGWHSTDWIGDRSVEEIGRWEKDRPGLLMASFVKPHHPFDPPQRWLNQYDAADLELPAGWCDAPDPRDLALHAGGYGGHFRHEDLTEATLRRVMAHYFATISQMDEQIGRMLDELDRRDFADDTLVVLTADHGEYLGHRHLLLKNSTMYDPIVRVPLVIRRPGGGAGRHDGLCSLLDLPRTILAAAGLDVPETMSDSLDLADAEAGRDIIFTEYHDAVMVRTATHKLIWHSQPEGRRLYDLRNDPQEARNLWDDADFAGVRCDLTDRLLDWSNVAAVGPAMLRPRPADDAERGRRVAATAALFDAS